LVKPIAAGVVPDRGPAGEWCPFAGTRCSRIDGSTTKLDVGAGNVSGRAFPTLAGLLVPSR
jgi:hypothetical protein